MKKVTSFCCLFLYVYGGTSVYWFGVMLCGVWKHAVKTEYVRDDAVRYSETRNGGVRKHLIYRVVVFRTSRLNQRYWRLIGVRIS